MVLVIIVTEEDEMSSLEAAREMMGEQQSLEKNQREVMEYIERGGLWLHVAPDSDANRKMVKVTAAPAFFDLSPDKLTFALVSMASVALEIAIKNALQYQAIPKEMDQFVDRMKEKISEWEDFRGKVR